MTPERLKELAEAAGLVPHLPHGYDAADAWIDPNDRRFFYFHNDPALLPFIAERLVERVKDMDPGGMRWRLADINCCSTAAQRAEAAFAVLQEADDGR